MFIGNIEKCQKTQDKGGETRAVFTDLFKVFNHCPFILKLHLYGVDQSSFNFIHFHLKARKQRTKVNSCFCSWKAFVSGVPLGSILDLPLLNVLIASYFPKQTLSFQVMQTKYPISTRFVLIT